MMRREFIKASALGAGTLAAGAGIEHAAAATPGLPSSQSRPDPDLGSHWAFFEKLSAQCTPQMSFLEDKYTDPEAWAKEARAALLDHFHYSPPPCDPAPELIESVDCGDYTREYLMISTTPNIRIPAYVLVPKGLTKPAPAINALHDHGGFYFWGKEKLVKVEPENPVLTAFKDLYYSGRSLADELAAQGYVVLVSDMLHWGERALYLENDPPRIKNRTLAVDQEDITAFNARSWNHEELMSRTALACGASWSGINMWDDIRMTDYLLSRPEVDKTRVGCLGLSLGSVRTIFLGALHPAVRVSVAVCWMAAYQGMTRNNVRNGIGFTKLVPGLYNDLDWPDVAGLHWPGALMTINGLQDQLYPLEAAQEATAKTEQIFTKAGTPGVYEPVYFDGPHEFNAAMQERAFRFMKQHLG